MLENCKPSQGLQIKFEKIKKDAVSYRRQQSKRNKLVITFSVKLDNKNSIEHCTKYHEVMPDERFYNSTSETKSSAQIETNYGVFVLAGISIVYSHSLFSQVVRFMYNPVIRKCEFNQVVDEI